MCFFFYEFSHLKYITMKQKILTSIIFTGITIFSNAQNISQSGVQQFTSILPAPASGPYPQLLTGERFRFRSGAVTQLDTLTAGFTFNPTDTWFTFGRVNVPGGQSFYGSRFQNNGKALVMGFSATSPTATPGNTRIEWIGATAASAGNLEFRSGIGFGAPGSPGTKTLVASMTPLGNTIFGNINPAFFASTTPKVGIGSTDLNGFEIRMLGTTSSGQTRIGQYMNIQHSSAGFGSFIECIGGQNSTAIYAKSDATDNSIGVQGVINDNQNTFGAAIWGQGAINGSNQNNWAGFFDGDVFCTAGNFSPSDEKLKQNINTETSVLEQISLLRPVSYTFKNVEGITLARGNQHGFISQEMAEVFPELTKDMTKPVFDEDGNVVSQISLKAINYIGLISVLTAGIQELNTELSAVREELDEYKANDNVRSQLTQDNRFAAGYSMEQNTPNPFDDRSVIRYQLAPGVNQASITIFNLNGGFVKDYAIDGNKGEITVLASETGKGMFIYSLTQNGQEMISKRMIVK